MAKGPFILHGASKKIGNMVVYKNPNSNNADTTVAREYVAEVKNPKTRQQAIQRMRMLPTQQFYRAFREILDHSWQGIKYGGRSYAHFMKAALADKELTIPYLLKGTTDFVPGAYPISQGSLATVFVNTVFDGGQGVGLNINCPTIGSGGDPTIGDLAQGVVENNDGFKYGDYLTFVFVTKSQGQYTASYFRVQLIENDTKLLDELPLKLGKAAQGDAMTVTQQAGSPEMYALGVIHSRKPAEGSTVWQRSNASLILAGDAITNYTTDDAKEAAIASYQSNAGNVNAHWYLNGGAQ